MSQPPQATDRRGGWGALVSALLVLALVGVVALWLRCAGHVHSHPSATAYVEFELPPPVPADVAETDGGTEPAQPQAEIAAPPAETGVPEAAPAADGEPAPSASEGAQVTPAPADPAPQEAEQPDAAMAPPPAPEPPNLERPTPERLMTEQPALAPQSTAAESARPEATASQVPESPSQPPDPGTPEAEPGIEAESAATEPAAPEAPAAEAAPAEDAAGSSEAPQLAAAGLPSAVPDAALPPWRRFAQAFPADDRRPRIAIIVAELGLSSETTRAAIERLPAAVTLSFSPYGRALPQWIGTAREDGHEVLLDLPMEPVSYPHDDPGPKALLTTLSDSENLARLDSILDQADGYVGVVPWMGSRFTRSAEDLRPMLGRIRERGLLFVDARASPDSVAAQLANELDVPRAVNDRFLDHVASRAAIDARLAQIERVARTSGSAVAMASPYPVTIERLEQWIPTLERKGLVLAPISAIAGQQAGQ